MQAREGDFIGTVAAVIDLNSDLKGGVIISSIDVNARGVSETQQAEILPRTYMIAMQSGIDSIFWYNFRAREENPYYNEDNFGIIHNDLSAKPAYQTFKVLSMMVPDGSVPISGVWQTGTIYHPGWQRPDGKNVFALWTTAVARPVKLEISGTITGACDLYGKKLKIGTERFELSTGPVYIIGPESVKIVEI